MEDIDIDVCHLQGRRRAALNNGQLTHSPLSSTSPAPPDNALPVLPTSGHERKLETPKIMVGSTINPYLEVLERYPTREHQDKARHERNEQQKELMLKHPKVNVDTILKETLEGKPDPRLSVTLVSRPSTHVRQYAKRVQEQLKTLVPSIYIAPEDNLHITLLEAASIVDQATVDSVLAHLKPNLDELTKVVCDDAPMLDTPLLCFDATAIALSFITAPESIQSHIKHRAEMYDFVSKSGINITSRYFGPSAHVTLARFTHQVEPETVEKLVHGIEAINNELKPLKWKIDNLECTYGRNFYGFDHSL